MSDNQKIDAFFQRIEQRLQQSNTVPAELTHLIQQNDLKEIYKYFLNHRAYITAKLSIGKPWRLDKTRTKLARTLNIIFEPITQEPILILETKSKNALNQKDPKTKVCSGSYKSTKVAWRIDSSKPEKIANAVFYIEKVKKEPANNLTEEQAKEQEEKRAKKQAEKIEDALQDTKKEVNFPNIVAKSNPDEEVNVNRPVLGQVIEKSGKRKYNSKKYVKKISFYSAWAQEGTLDSFLKTEKGKALTPDQLNQLAKQLIKGLKAIHKSGVIHQDIKAENILVLRDNAGNYQLEFADFGISVATNDPKFSKEPALATLEYGSPEIIAANNKRKDPSKQDTTVVPYHHAYYFNQDTPCYGREFGKTFVYKAEYDIPHKANDCWALGVVLHELYKKTKPSLDNQPNFTPLIAKLLDPNRESRCTAEQALEFIEREEAEAQEKFQAEVLAQAKAQAEALAQAKLQAEALEREAQATKARAETMEFLCNNNGFHPGYQSSKPQVARPRKISHCNMIFDWVNDQVKRTRFF